MPVIRAGKGANFTFEVGDLDSDVLRVLRFHGREGISALFGFEIDLVSSETHVKFDDVVGKPAKLEWVTEDGTRVIHGIVSRFEQTGSGRQISYYHATVVPKLWTLTLQWRCRIFQDKATPDILKEVLEEGGVPSDQFKLSLKASYPPRKYCVQYRESDFDFLSRLMEEEGIWYCFQHGDDGAVLLLGDAPSTAEKIAGEAELPYREGESGMAREEHVRSFRFARSMRTGAVTLNDFDFKKPKTSLKVEQKADVEAHLVAYDYPGEYPDSGIGKRLVQVRLEEERAERDLGIGEGDCRRLEAGCRFTLEDHPADDLNQEYLLVRVEHWGDQKQGGVADAGSKAEEPTYRNRFECIPAGVPWRPPRETPQPTVEGPQTAIVTTPSGEEIHCDEHGRVKVKFHWDLDGPKDDKSSCWIRISQGWSSAGWGAVFLPRKDDEVVVEFLEGDPDRPLITGRVYNGLSPVPYDLPGSKTRSTIKTMSTPGGGGYNELRFEDAKGSEEIYLQGEKDWNILIKNDETQNVGHDRKKTIGHDETTHVKHDRTETVDNNEKITIDGHRTESVAKSESITIGGARSEKVAADETITISGSRIETVTKDESVSIGKDRKLSVGAGETTSIAAARKTQVGKNDTLSVGQDQSVDVGKNMTVGAGGNFGVTAEKDGTLTIGKKLVLDAGDQITLKAGSASIVLKKNGDIDIKGKNINIKGSGNVIMKGSKIQQN